MKDECWKQFTTTGKVEDYLSYKAQSREEERKETAKEAAEGAGAGKGESDCIDRNGALYGTGRRV